jgi:hypothetical protein
VFGFGHLFIDDPLEDQHLPAVFVGNWRKGNDATVRRECAGFVSRMTL